MERYGNRTEAPKATVERPWVFTISPDSAAKLDSVSSLINNGFIQVPVQKRSLYILSAAIKTAKKTGNLSCLDPEAWNQDDLIAIQDPASSIAAPAQRIIDHLHREDLDLNTFGRIIVFGIGLDEESNGIFLNDLSFIISKVSNRTIEVHLFTDREELPVIFSSAEKKAWQPQAARPERKQPAEGRRPESKPGQQAPRKEYPKMQNRKPEKVDLTSMPERIRQTLEQTLAYPEPEELEQIKQMIRKNVPFGRRTYFAAYLLLRAAGTPAPRQERKPRDSQPRQRNDRADRPAPAAKTKARTDEPARKADRPQRERPAVRKAPENAKNFYINLGGQDRMNPAKLASFIAQAAGISPDQVCAISMKGSYSFFSVAEELADRIIPSLEGKSTGYKQIKVNYANGPKKDRAEAPAAEDAAPTVAEPVSEPVVAPESTPEPVQEPEPAPEPAEEAPADTQE